MSLAYSLTGDQRKRADAAGKVECPRYPSYSVTVTGNDRIIFRFVDGNAVDVDYLDYH